MRATLAASSSLDKSDMVAGMVATVGFQVHSPADIMVYSSQCLAIQPIELTFFALCCEMMLLPLPVVELTSPTGRLLPCPLHKLTALHREH
jgi:hypothetical protein